MCRCSCSASSVFATRFNAHHRLVTDETGKRLAKRDKARSLEELRAKGQTAADIRTALPPLPDYSPAIAALTSC